MRVSSVCKFCYNEIFVANYKLSSYARYGNMELARKTFDEMSERSTVSWNSMISGYFRNGRPEEARRLFDQMPERNIISWNGMISGYVENGRIEDACKMFDKMPERNVLSWTAMVRGYVQEGRVREAEMIFQTMPEKNVVSWTVMMGGLIQDDRIDAARRMFDEMPERDVVAWTNMISGYCGVGRIAEARELFDRMPQRNVVSWTSMISGYVQNCRVDLARKLFEVMPEKNEVSWTAMLTGYTLSGRVEEASELFKRMPQRSTVACNAMIDGYSRNGKLPDAQRVFDEMGEKDDGSWAAIVTANAENGLSEMAWRLFKLAPEKTPAIWSAMIKGYGRNGFELEALDLFISMERSGVRPTHSTLITVLSICASLATLDQGRQIHAYIMKFKFDSDVYISSSLINMYFKCGNLDKARLIFDLTNQRDIVTWNSMISGYAQHGLGEEALQVFREMCSLGLIPDDVTLVGVLSACSYTGRVKEGWELFKLMGKYYLIEPKAVHYACMVDLLGRAGYVYKAMDLIKNMPIEADAVIWGALLGACRTHSNLELAEVAAKKLLEIEPANSGHYVLLSNIYASTGRWDDVAKLRRDMKERNVSKARACSWIEIENRVHVFVGGEVLGHPDHELIIGMLEKLGGMLREVGYCPDSSFVLHDVDEEEKVHCLEYHSEKLAVAFGILRVPANVPIRIMKNLRVCGDCHSAIKLIARITGREIILRDASRFHHFKGGSCSCKDYW